MTKLNSLEDKIKEYLKGIDKLNWYPPITDTQFELLAHDIAEIAENYYAANLGFTDLMKENTMLVKENKEALEAVERLMNDNTELEATLDDNNLQIKNTIELEKEIEELKERFKADECDLCNDLQDEVEELGIQKVELEDKLNTIRYLNRDEVDEIVTEIWDNKIISHLDYETADDEIIIMKSLDEMVITICSLAYEPITRGKIINVLKKYKVICTTPGTNFLGDNEQIADEILNDKDK